MWITFKIGQERRVPIETRGVEEGCIWIDVEVPAAGRIEHHSV